MGYYFIGGIQIGKRFIYAGPANQANENVHRYQSANKRWLSEGKRSAWFKMSGLWLE
jgi:hypothetical protein